MDIAAPRGHLRYFPAVDGLRAVAVLSVIAFHLDAKLLPGGYVGVDVFFVISGFVVTNSLRGLSFSSVTELLGYFYARRLLRIMPAALLMLLVTAVLSEMFIPEAWLSNSISETGKAAFFGLSNVTLALQTDTYFAPRASYNPFVHTWSLGVEEQFYLLFPFLMFWHARRSAIPVIAAFGLASLIACAVLAFTWWSMAFYSIAARFWELAIGMLLALTMERWQASAAIQRARTLLPGAGWVLLGTAFLIPESTFFPFPLALLPTIGTALLIVTVCSDRAASTARLLSTKPALWIGLRSYSLYLWHWPVFVLARWTYGVDQVAQMLSALSLTFLLAAASFRFVEEPFRRGRIRRTMARRYIIGGALLSTCGAALAGAAVFAKGDHIALSATRDRATWHPDVQAPWIREYSRCQVSRSSEGLAGGRIYSYHPAGCPAPARQQRLFAIGDSHNLAYRPIYAALAGETGMQIRVVFKAGCPFLSLSETLSDRPECADYYREALSMLKGQLRAGDILFMPSLRLSRYNEQGAETAPAQPMEVSQPAVAEALEILSELGATGAHLVFEAPKPIFRSPPFRCSDWFNRSNPACSSGFSTPRAVVTEQRRSVVDAMRLIQRRIPAATMWDPLPILCPATVCHAVTAGGPLFFDGDHLSGYGNAILYPSFRAHILGVAGRANAAPAPVPGPRPG